jgi:putative iron-regulated protein
LNTVFNFIFKKGPAAHAGCHEVMTRALSALLFPVLVTCAFGCGSTDTEPGTTTGTQPLDARPVVENYAVIVHTNYEDIVTTAEALKVAIDAFVASPSQASLDLARTAWLDARTPYGQSESYRFYGGPIDDDDGPEGRINGWPLDESYIDYVVGSDMAGIINRPADFPEITKQVIADNNELGGEKNLSAGYHAIEFLLWGQDQSADGPGDRPFTDYVTGGTGTAANQDRRGEYLKSATELLVEDLHAVEEQWEPGEAGTYVAEFLAGDPQAAVGKMLTGMGSLSGAELSRERMNNALQEQDQEEEHSCFSDNTLADLLANATAVENVYLGRYGVADGPGLDELVRARNAALDDTLKAQLTAVLTAIKAIPAPFDQAIVGADGQAKVQTAIDALKAVTDTLVEVATLLGVTINLGE